MVRRSPPTPLNLINPTQVPTRFYTGELIPIPPARIFLFPLSNKRGLNGSRIILAELPGLRVCSSGKSMSVNLCSGCDGAATLRCAACKLPYSFYCSKTCQKKLWSTHRFNCVRKEEYFRLPDLRDREIEEFFECYLFTAATMTEMDISVGTLFTADITVLMMEIKKIKKKELQLESTKEYIKKLSNEFKVLLNAEPIWIQQINISTLRGQVLYLWLHSTGIGKANKGKTVPLVSTCGLHELYTVISSAETYDLEAIQDHPTPELFMKKVSNYFFLLNNFLTVYLSEDYDTSQEGGESLWFRVNEEVERMKKDKINGGFEFISTGWEVVNKRYEFLMDF